MKTAGYDEHTLDRAKALRRELTSAERQLWKLLRAKRLGDFKFRRQQPIGPYIADFVCQAARMIVEADGSQHLDSDYDTGRTAWLEARGYRVLRYWNNDILARSEQVVEAIYLALTAPSPSHAQAGAGPSLSLKGRGEEGLDYV